MKMHELFEADSKTKTKTKTKVDTDFWDSAFFGDDDDKNLPANAPKKDGPKADKAPPKAVSKEKTDKATAGIKLSDKALDYLKNMKTDGLPVDDGTPEPETAGTDLVVKSANVPKVISSAMKEAGFVDPDFHLVSNLPGNMADAIRKLGKVLFKSLTRTPTDSISMIGNLQGQGPNSKKEVDAVANYVKKHGKDLGPGEIDFEPVMPGYKAQVHNYVADGVFFMLVKDMMGEYVYCWPAKETIGHTNQAKLK